MLRASSLRVAGGVSMLSESISILSVTPIPLDPGECDIEEYCFSLFPEVMLMIVVLLGLSLIVALGSMDGRRM